MALGSLVCRKLNLVPTVPIAKPKILGGSGGSRSPSKFKLIIGGFQQMEFTTKAKKLERGKNTLFVSFAPEKAKEEIRKEITGTKPSTQTEKQKFVSHFQKKIETENSPSFSRAGCDIRTAMTSSTSTQKGLQNAKKGKFRWDWMVQWSQWYSYVNAMHTAKALAVRLINSGKMFLSELVRAATAKTAWQ